MKAVLEFMGFVPNCTQVASLKILKMALPEKKRFLTGTHTELHLRWFREAIT